MKCAIAESYTHIGQAQIDKGEVRDRASVEHNREDEDHTGTPVRERELEYQGDTWVLLIHNSARIYSDLQKCPNVWYFLILLTITYQLPQIEKHCKCIKNSI